MKKILVVAVILITLLPCFKVSAKDIDIAAEHAIAVEASTGKILYAKNANTPDGIASMTKILTVYIVYKEIEAGNLSWETDVKVSDYAFDLTNNAEASNVPMLKRKYKVRELVNATLVASANSVAIALAEHISGSESQFVDKMTAQLKEWGIEDAILVNASGLNNSFLGKNRYSGSKLTAENMMSARDVAIVARHLITEYPKVLEITKQTLSSFDGAPIQTYNFMLPGMDYGRVGVDGLKTGTTHLAGASFVCTSTENGMRIITVVMNAFGWQNNSYARFEATNQLLDYVKNNYQFETIVDKRKSYKGSKVKVNDGKQREVALIASKAFTVVRKGEHSAKVHLVTKNEGYQAPISKRQILGKLVYKDNDKLGYLGKTPSIPMVAKEEVKRSFFLKVWWSSFVRYVNKKL